MQIVSASSAFAKHYYPQAVLLQALEKYWDAELKNPELLHCLRKTATYRRHRYWWYWKKSLKHRRPATGTLGLIAAMGAWLLF